MATVEIVFITGQIRKKLATQFGLYYTLSRISRAQLTFRKKELNRPTKQFHYSD